MFRESEDYEHFADFIRTKSRYVLDGWQQDFVNTIVETSKKRTTTLPANQILWRAALGYENPHGVHPHEVFFLDEIKPHKIERLKPLRDRAHEGRVKDLFLENPSSQLRLPAHTAERRRRTDPGDHHPG